MSDTTGMLLGILAGADPIGAILYERPSVRESLVELCRLLAPAGRPLRVTSDVTDAFGDPGTILLLTLPTEKEEDAVLALDGRRDALLARTAPAVLFLLRGGGAEERLREDAAGLESILRGLVFDPEPRRGSLDGPRAAFEAQAGRSPEAWLGAWRRGEIDDTAENNVLAHHAALLEKAS